MWGAQLFIYTVYVVYGCFVYFVSENWFLNTVTQSR
jgi:hypothetical protein